MAKIMLTGVDELTLKLSNLETGSDEIAKKAIYKGAGVMADQIRSNLEKNLAGSETSTGDLIDSLGVSPIKEDRAGNWNAKVGFDGYDRNGTPNALKARVMESGTSTHQKRPFVRPAINQARNKAKDAMREVIDKEIDKVMKG